LKLHSIYSVLNNPNATSVGLKNSPNQEKPKPEPSGTLGIPPSTIFLKNPLPKLGRQGLAFVKNAEQKTTALALSSGGNGDGHPGLDWRILQGVFDQVQ
jgi:hypothetical protein